MSAPDASVIEAALRERAPEACLRALWLDAPVVPPLRGARALRGVFTLPHARVATLRHWRDSHEWTADYAGERWDVVLHEASTWARLLMKSHGGSVAIASRAPTFDPLGLGAKLAALAAACADARTDAWYTAAGWSAPARAAATLEGAARFERLDAWVRAARDA